MCSLLYHPQGDLMAMNHHLLNAVGVGHPALTAVVDAAASAGPHTGGFACKLTGAGGGGCAIILSPVPYTPVASEQQVNAGAGAVEVALGGLVDKLRSVVAGGHYIHGFIFLS